MRWVWLLAVVVACKSDEAEEARPIIPAPITFASGSRLHATFQEVDGVKIFVGWQDVLLGKPCEFFGGRCLPGTTRTEPNELALFEDDACSARLARMSEDSAFDAPFDVIAYVSGTPICSELSLHVRGEAVTTTRVFHRNSDTGACEEIPAAGEYVRVGPALGPDDHTFVTAKEENDAAAARIVPRWRVGDDGSRQIIAAWDTERNEIVAAGLPLSGKRWLPRNYATVGADSSCPDYATSFDSCEPAVAFVGGGGCREPEIFALGAEVPASTCSRAGSKLYEVASKVPASVYALAEDVLVGAGRIRLTMSGANGKPVEPRRFFDTEARVSCTPSASPEDPEELRCLPDADSRVAPAYSEEGCTKKAALFTPGAGACDATPDVPRFVMLSGEPVEIGERIYAAWQSNSAGGCDPVLFANDSSAYLVTPAERSRFAPVVMKTE